MEALKFLIYNSQSQWKIKPSVVDKNLILIPGEILASLTNKLAVPTCLFQKLQPLPVTILFVYVCVCMKWFLSFRLILYSLISVDVIVRLFNLLQYSLTRIC